VCPHSGVGSVGIDRVIYALDARRTSGRKLTVDLTTPDLTTPESEKPGAGAPGLSNSRSKSSRTM
jgi:hypothetical protein